MLGESLGQNSKSLFLAQIDTWAPRHQTEGAPILSFSTLFRSKGISDAVRTISERWVILVLRNSRFTAATRANAFCSLSYGPNRLQMV